jgi:6-phosphogluconolactonase
MASKPDLLAFETRGAMAAHLADMIEADLARAIDEHGAAIFAVSGGSTPAGLYDALSKRPLDWGRVTVLLVDERWIAPGETGSNETFVRNTLLRNRAEASTFIGLWSEALSPAAGLAVAEKRLAAATAAIDVVVLGMGNDGHTASWFPGCEGLDRALDVSGSRLAAITAQRSEVTGDNLQRMTLTLGAIENARLICLLITGEEKRAIFDKARRTGPVEEMPVRAILRARPDLRACWAP